MSILNMHNGQGPHCNTDAKKEENTEVNLEWIEHTLNFPDPSCSLSSRISQIVDHRRGRLSASTGVLWYGQGGSRPTTSPVSLVLVPAAVLGSRPKLGSQQGAGGRRSPRPCSSVNDVLSDEMVGTDHTWGSRSYEQRE